MVLRNEVTGKWRRQHYEKLSDLHHSPNVIRVILSRRMRWRVQGVHMGEKRGAYKYKILVGKPEAKRPLGRSRHRLEGNIKMDLQEVGWGYRLD